MDAAQQRFTNLYDSHYRSILAYFMRRLDSTPAAQDLTEDVFLVAWRKLDQVPEADAALYWLYAVARRTLAGHLRRATNRRRLAPRLRETIPAVIASPEEQLVRNDEARMVLGTMAQLRPADQELIQLAYWDELPHQAIADLLGCSRAAVDVRLHRAIRRLRKALAHSGHLPVEEISTQSPKEPQW